MIYFLDAGVNMLLNIAGMTGLTSPHEIIIAVVLASAAVLWNSTLVPRWLMSVFFTLMVAAMGVALYALVLGRQPACLHVYNDQKPIIADSLDRKLTWAEVRSFDCPTLWVARNEMFYRSNYCFFTPVAFSYFRNDGTCDPAVEEPKTHTGIDNAKLIRRMETRRNCPAPIEACGKLGGVSASRLMLGRQTQPNEP